MKYKKNMSPPLSSSHKDRDGYWSPVLFCSQLAGKSVPQDGRAI